MQHPLVIKATDLRKLHVCHRQAWLDIHGDVSEQDQLPEQQVIRLIEGQAHERRVYEATTPEVTQIAISSWREGVEMTREFFAKGGRTLLGAYLEAPAAIDGIPIRVLGRPDRLVRFGYRSDMPVYAPVEIKSAGEVSPADELQLDCYIWLLGQIQGVSPPAEFWMGRDANGYPAERIKHQYDGNRLQQAIRQLVRYHLDRDNEPDVYIDSRCRRCRWFSACRKKAQATFDISLIFRLRQDSAKALNAANILTLDQLVRLEPQALRRFKGIKTTAEQFHAHARAWLQDEPIFYRPLPSVCVGDAWHVDIEYDPETQILWSIGWSRNDETPYTVLVAPDQSPRIMMLLSGLAVQIVTTTDEAWQFFAVAVSGDNLPIFHWGPADRTMLMTSAPADIRYQLEKRFIDLNRIFEQTVQLPVYGMTIKVIGEYLGFTWSAYNNPFAAFGDYQRWLAMGDEDALARLSAYQSDDVTALAIAQSWLVDNHPYREG